MTRRRESEPLRMSRVGWRAWTGLAASPAAWAFHHQIGSELNFADCAWGDARSTVLTGLASVIVIAVGGLVSWWAWRKAGGAGRSIQDQSGRFVPLLGMMASVLFGLTVLFQTSAGLIIPACAR